LAEEARSAGSPDSGSSTSAGGQQPAGPLTEGEQTAALDDELARSLAEFDGQLLREQELLEKERREGAQAAAADEASAAASSGGYSGGGEYADMEPTDGQESGGGGATGEETVEQDGEKGGSSAGGGGGDRVPSDLGDGSDDDIIARQLREAAMAENDPELREKLWDEYREYKSGKKN